MSRIEYLIGTSQELFFVLDFLTRMMHVFIVFHNKLVEADLSARPFDGLLCLPWLENEIDPGREVSDLMLDCVYSDEGVLSMKILPGLLEMMPWVDPSTIMFGVCDTEKGQGVVPCWGEIRFIVMYGSLQENYFLGIKDDKLLIREYKESDPRGWDDDYTPYGSGKPEGKGKREAKKEEPDRGALHEDKEPEPRFVPGRTKEHLTVVKPLRKFERVGRRLKLYFIPPAFYNSASFAGLKLGEIETYRIIRTYAPLAGGGSKKRYNEVGIMQLCGLLKRRKADLLSFVRGEKRKDVEKIRISDRSVRRYLKKLLKRGLLDRVVKGVPKSYKTGRSYVSKYLVVTSEKQWYRLIQERKKRRSL